MIRVFFWGDCEVVVVVVVVFFLLSGNGCFEFCFNNICVLSFFYGGREVSYIEVVIVFDLLFFWLKVGI